MASKTELGGDVPENAIPETLGEHEMAIMLTGRRAVISSTLVADIEHKTAELIDIAEGLKANDPELSKLAIRSYEVAAFWAIKAATS